MTHEERAHIERLLAIHRASLRELEVQAATFGDLHVPVHVKLQIAEHQRKIAELEARMAELLPLHNLPPCDYERFVGRQKELVDVRRLLLPYPKSRYHLITIDGIGGIGKSALALEAAYSYCDGYAALPEAERFGAIVWVSAKRSYLTADGILERRQAFRTLDDLYAAIAQVLDFPAITRARAEEQRAIVEQVLGEQRTLLILDNLETVDDEDLLVFLRELPDPTKAIVTTRHRIDVARPVRLTGMPHEDALALIDQEAARKAVTLSADEREQLWQRTGGVPLAVVWSIGLMGLGGSVESVLRRLGSGQSDIAKFCFEESVAQIRSRDAYWLLLALSLFAADASREALGFVAGLGEDAFGRDIGLEELLRLSLVNKSGNRFSLLPLTRSFAEQEFSQDPNWTKQTRSRLAGYIYQLPKMDEKGWISWDDVRYLEQEFINIRAINSLLIDEIECETDADGELRVINSSIDIAERYLALNRVLVWASRYAGYWSESEAFCRFGIEVARLLGDNYSIGYRYHELSSIYRIRGELIQAKRMAEAAIIAFKKCNQLKAAAHSQRQLGIIALSERNITLSKTLVQDAYKNYVRLGGVNSRVSYYDAFGQILQEQGNLAAAEKCLQKAVALSRTRDEIQRVSHSLYFLGRVYLESNDLKHARMAMDEGLQLANQCRRVELIAFNQLGLAAVATRLHDRTATNYARQALDLFRRLGMHKEQAEAEDLLRQIGESV